MGCAVSDKIKTEATETYFVVLPTEAELREEWKRELRALPRNHDGKPVFEGCVVTLFDGVRVRTDG